MTLRTCEPTETSLPPKEANPWARFTTAEGEAKLRQLRKPIDSGIPTDRSMEHQLKEVRIIETELSRRDDR